MSIDDDVKAAVHQVAQAKIAEALGGDVLSKIVNEVMNHRQDRYGSDKRTFFDITVHDAVAGVIRKGVAEFVGKDETLRQSVKESISAKASDFTLTVLDAFDSDDWRANLSVTIQRRDDD